MNRIIVSLLVLLTWGASHAQTHRYMVFFTDKAGTGYPYSLSTPTDFLTQRALDRRAKQSIAVDESDLPVDPAYVQNLRNNGVEVYFTSRWMNGAIVQMDATQDLPVVESLSFVDSVTLVAENARLSTTQLPVTFPGFSPPPSVSGSSTLQLTMLGADLMHEEDIKGQGMLIAILDNGFIGVNETQPFEHLWQGGQIIAYKDFVENSGNVFRYHDHGTSVFSIIAAQHNTVYSGIAPEADFILCVTEESGSEDRIEEFNWLLGAEYADSLGADVINASLGYNQFDISAHDYTYEDLDGNTTIVSRAAKMASEKGMVVVVSAGNEGNNPPGTWRHILPPADAEGILAIGSVNPDFTRSSFSSLGPTSDDRIKPDVAALGLGTTVVRDDGQIEQGNGTSFASPLIAGFAAGVWQSNPEWTAGQVVTAIRNSGHKVWAPDNSLGYGVPNYTYAVEGKVLNVNELLDDGITFYPNPFQGNKLFLKVEEALPEDLSIRVTTMRGTIIYEQSVDTMDVQGVMELSLGRVKKGIYLLILESGDRKKVAKLINL